MGIRCMYVYVEYNLLRVDPFVPESYSRRLSATGPCEEVAGLRR